MNQCTSFTKFKAICSMCFLQTILQFCIGNIFSCGRCTWNLYHLSWLQIFQIRLNESRCIDWSECTNSWVYSYEQFFQICLLMLIVILVFSHGSTCDQSEWICLRWKKKIYFWVVITHDRAKSKYMRIYGEFRNCNEGILNNFWVWFSNLILWPFQLQSIDNTK